MEFSRAMMEEKLDALSGELASLLDRHSQGPPDEPPDYGNFCPELQAISAPFFEYDDYHFHQHDNGEFYFSRSASDVISAKKWSLEQWLHNNGHRTRRGDTKALRRFKQFKLLLKYFSYESDEPKARQRRLFDLQYCINRETDEVIKRKIRDEIEDICGSLAAAKHVQAVDLFQRGEHLSALRKTQEALEQFPGATKTAALGVEILEAMKQATLHGALVEEPRDRRLQFEYSLLARINSAREALAEGTLSRETFLERLHGVACSAAERMDLSHLEKKFTDEFPFTLSADARPVRFLATGEYILSSFPAEADFAPAAVEFAKALELVVEVLIFAPLKLGLGASLPTPVKGSPDEWLVRYLAGGKALTLGQAGFIFQQLSSRKKVEAHDVLRRLDNAVDSAFQKNHFQDLKALLSHEKIETYRNLAVHSSIFPKDKAQEALSWVREGLVIFESSVVPSRQVSQDAARLAAS